GRGPLVVAARLLILAEVERVFGVEPGEEARGHAPGEQAARFHPIDLVEQRIVTLINRRNISIGDEWFDGILQLREAERVDIEDALDFAGEPGADIGQFAMQEAAVAQWPQRQTVVPDTAAGSHWRHRDGVPRDIVEGFVHADLAEAIRYSPSRIGMVRLGSRSSRSPCCPWSRQK